MSRVIYPLLWSSAIAGSDIDAFWIEFIELGFFRRAAQRMPAGLSLAPGWVASQDKQIPGRIVWRRCIILKRNDFRETIWSIQYAYSICRVGWHCKEPWANDAVQVIDDLGEEFTLFSLDVTLILQRSPKTLRTSPMCSHRVFEIKTTLSMYTSAYCHRMGKKITYIARYKKARHIASTKEHANESQESIVRSEGSLIAICFVYFNMSVSVVCV